MEKMSAVKEKIGLAIREDKKNPSIYCVVHEASGEVLFRFPYKEWAQKALKELKPVLNWEEEDACTKAKAQKVFKDKITAFEKQIKHLIQESRKGMYIDRGYDYNDKDGIKVIPYKARFSDGAGEVVPAKVIAPGIVAYRASTTKDVEIWTMGNILWGQVIGKVPSLAAAKHVAEHLSKVADWTNRNTYNLFYDDEELSNFREKTIDASFKGTRFPHVTVKMKKKVESLIARNSDIKHLLDALDVIPNTESVKKRLEDLMVRAKGEQKIALEEDVLVMNPTLNAVFMGHQGLGKTQVARIYANALYRLGYIKDDKFSVFPMETVKTPEQLKMAIDNAKNEVLLIDNFHLCVQIPSRDQGREMIHTVVEGIRNRMHSAVIVSGEKDILEAIFKEFPELDVQFPDKFHFQDLESMQLAKLFIRDLKARGYDADDVSDEANKHFRNMKGSISKALAFSEKVIEKQMIRIAKDSKEAEVQKIKPEDVREASGKGEAKSETTTLSDVKEAAIGKMDELVGLGDLKKEMKRLMNYLSVEKKRYEKGISGEKPMLHMAFKGDPGTGKTTMARIVAEYLKGIGFLESGHLVEVSRSDLVAMYLGQTAPKVKSVLNRARGGVLFIDEAYSLAQDMYGDEAIAELIKGMEDMRDDLVVIMAGYDGDMDRLLKANPGFESRVPYKFKFQSYTAEEVTRIVEMELEKAKLLLNEEARKALSKIVSDATSTNGGSVNGNGRWARTFVEKVRIYQADRIEETESEDLETVFAEDLKQAYGVIQVKKQEKKLGFSA